MDICDACGGEGAPLNGLLCMCGGTGKMSDAGRWLREQLVKTEAELEAAQARIKRLEGVLEIIASKDIFVGFRIAYRDMAREALKSE